MTALVVPSESQEFHCKPFVTFAGLRLHCAPPRLHVAVKTCGTTNKENRRPGNPWAIVAG